MGPHPRTAAAATPHPRRHLLRTGSSDASAGRRTAQRRCGDQRHRPAPTIQSAETGLADPRHPRPASPDSTAQVPPAIHPAAGAWRLSEPALDQRPVPAEPRGPRPTAPWRPPAGLPSWSCRRPSVPRSRQPLRTGADPAARHRRFGGDTPASLRLDGVVADSLLLLLPPL